MKLKKLLIPAVILFLIGGTAKICDTLFNVNGNGFFLSSQACNLTLAASFLLLYILGFALSVADRKKTFIAVPTNSISCGLFGFIASVALIGGGVVRLISGTDNLAESITAIIAGFLLLYEACIYLTGTNGMTKMPVAALILPVWGCIRFIGIFVNYTQKSLRATELFDIIAVGFLIMFLFYQAMFLAGINNRLAVRKTVVYGSVYIMLGLIVAADLIIKMVIGKQPIPNVDTQVVEPSILNIITIVGDIAFCGYAFFLIRSMLKNADAHLTMPDDNMNDDIILTPDVILQTEVADAEPVADSKDVEVSDELLTDISIAQATVEQTESEHEEIVGSPVIENEPEKPVPAVLDEQLPKVAEPAKTNLNNDSGAYDELFKMLDEIK